MWGLALIAGALGDGAPSAGESESDEALAARSGEGDRGAFETLYRGYAGVVFGRLSRLVGPVAERDDLTLDVFLGLYRALPRFRGEAAVSTLLYRITANVACDHLRRRGRRPIEPLERATLEGLVSDEAGPEARARRGRELARVFRALDGIAPKKRVALLLRVVEGLGFEEIGGIVGTSADTAKKRALHGLRELTALLGPSTEDAP
jgi:RNA polymerase sigma-70 factor (ECF subfamily)